MAAAFCFQLRTGRKLERIYRYALDEKEFLSPHGIRALSKFHQDHPFVLSVNGQSPFGKL